MLRKTSQRLPAFMQLPATAYSHVFAIDQDGNVLTSLQGPNSTHHTNTGALETDDWLYISSLHAENLARISRADAGI